MENRINVISLGLPPLSLGDVHFDTVELTREGLAAISVAVQIADGALAKAAAFGDARVLRAAREFLAGLPIRLAQIADGVPLDPALAALVDQIAGGMPLNGALAALSEQPS